MSNGRRKTDRDIARMLIDQFNSGDGRENSTDHRNPKSDIDEMIEAFNERRRVRRRRERERH